MIACTQRAVSCAVRRHTVEDHHAGMVVHVERLENVVDRLDLLIDVVGGGVNHMEQQVRIAQFIRVVRKAPTRSLGRSRINPTVSVTMTSRSCGEAQAAAGSVECFKKPVLGGNLAVRQRVEQGGFSGVRITDDGKNGEPCLIRRARR